MENDALPQYMRIARSIAQRIAESAIAKDDEVYRAYGELRKYLKDTKITLSSEVLQDRAVVIVREQSGVYVLSAEQARQCLAGFKDGGGLIGKKHRLRQLL